MNTKPTCNITIAGGKVYGEFEPIKAVLALIKGRDKALRNMNWIQRSLKNGNPDVAKLSLVVNTVIDSLLHGGSAGPSEVERHEAPEMKPCDGRNKDGLPILSTADLVKKGWLIPVPGETGAFWTVGLHPDVDFLAVSEIPYVALDTEVTVPDDIRAAIERIKAHMASPLSPAEHPESAQLRAHKFGVDNPGNTDFIVEDEPTLKDFKAGQWWVSELEASTQYGTIYQQQAFATLKRLLRTIKDQEPVSVDVDRAKGPDETVTFTNALHNHSYSIKVSTGDTKPSPTGRDRSQVEVAVQAFPSAQGALWDSKLRGERMSDATGRVIFKYQMPVREEFTMNLPVGAQIIRMADMDGFFWLWAVVDTEAELEERKFHAVKCGANVPDINGLEYRGFCAVFVQQELGLYIFEDTRYAKDI